MAQRGIGAQKNTGVSKEAAVCQVRGGTRTGSASSRPQTEPIYIFLEMYAQETSSAAAAAAAQQLHFTKKHYLKNSRAPHASRHTPAPILRVGVGQHFELFDSVLGTVKKVIARNHSLRVQYVR